MTAGSTSDGVADRVVLRYAPATDVVRRELGTARYASYLRTAEAGPVAVDDEWDHFVNCGCGSTTDVALAVESVRGGDRVGDRTAFGFVPASDADGVGSERSQ